MQAVGFYAENNSMKEFMWSIEMDMIPLLYKESFSVHLHVNQYYM